MKETIDLISKWSKIFNLPVHNTFNFPDEVQFNAHIGKIKEEVKELLDAFKADDNIGVWDAMGDIWWVAVRLNMLFGIPAHKHFYHYDFNYPAPMKLEEITPTSIDLFVDLIKERLDSIHWMYYSRGVTEYNPQDMEAMLWSLDAHILSLATWLKFDIIRAIDIVYESNMTKLCTMSVANESQKVLKAKLGKKIYIQLSPEHKNLPRFIGEPQEAYYLCTEDGVVKKPVNFVEPDWSKF
jgi:hypothetical protein